MENKYLNETTLQLLKMYFYDYLIAKNTIQTMKSAP